MARWFIALQLVFGPQEPIQGSTHFSRTQALSLGQSSLIEHSGAQRGGTPRYPGLQLQIAEPETSRQVANSPQGLGSHGEVFTGGSGLLLRHLENGSPSNPETHVQYGLCRCTRHSAFSPHVPTQGSTHFCLTQALLSGHSGLVKHSGRQFGGDPIYSCKQVHIA